MFMVLNQFFFGEIHNMKYLKYYESFKKRITNTNKEILCIQLHQHLKRLLLDLLRETLKTPTPSKLNSEDDMLPKIREEVKQIIFLDVNQKKEWGS